MTHNFEDGFYGKRARYYDRIYHWKDYAGESQRVRDLLAAEGIADGSRIIDAACGTGGHLVHLNQWFEVSGFDASTEMLDIAEQKLPDAPLRRADMTDFEEDAPADALVCLFSSIAYVFPEDRLRDAAACFARAVRPGGALLVEPWIDPDVYIAGHRMMHTYDGEDMKLCRMAHSTREVRGGVDLAVIDFFWMALEANSDQAEHFAERHEVWLCPRSTMRAIFEDAGFEMRLEPDGLIRNRGLFIGRRRG